MHFRRIRSCLDLTISNCFHLLIACLHHMSALPAPAFEPAESKIPEPQPALRIFDPIVEGEQENESRTDEELNFRTHLVGFVASVVATIGLCWVCMHVADQWLTLSCAAYGATMLAVYGFSTLSHAQFSDWKHHFFRTLDQVSIFLFIAASSTPFLVSLNRNPTGMFLLGMTWLLALGGVAAKLFITRRNLVPVWYYMIVGWFPALSLLQSWGEIGPAGMSILLLSGLGLTTATWFLCNDHKASWFHGVWHVLVLFSTLGQYSVILLFVIPWQA